MMHCIRFSFNITFSVCETIKHLWSKNSSSGMEVLFWIHRFPVGKKKCCTLIQDWMNVEMCHSYKQKIEQISLEQPPGRDAYTKPSPLIRGTLPF